MIEHKEHIKKIIQRIRDCYSKQDLDGKQSNDKLLITNKYIPPYIWGKMDRSMDFARTDREIHDYL